TKGVRHGMMYSAKENLPSGQETLHAHEGVVVDVRGRSVLGAGRKRPAGTVRIGPSSAGVRERMGKTNRRGGAQTGRGTIASGDGGVFFRPTGRGGQVAR